MQLGVFSKTFERESLEQVLDAVQHHGFSTVQFNFSSAGLPSMPDSIPEDLAKKIGEEFRARGLSIAALSGTYNMIHPDISQRERGLKRLGVLASRCKDLGTSVITMCTGSRNANNMWKHHPDNHSKEAWRDLVEHLEKALEVAEHFKITLGIEPEINNVIHSALKARKLLDTFQNKHLGVVLDAANLYQTGDLPDTKGILQQAFDLLGHDLVLAHVKDVTSTAIVFQQGRGMWIFRSI
jgi:sugar phosphate isomerase/epimerase